MGANHLANRSNWQYGARVVGDAGENTFATKIAEQLPAHYTVEVKPAKLLVYNDVNGIMLDTKITNTQSGKSLFVEKKTGNNGGNAHERAYKFLSDPLKERVRELCNTPDNPFFIVFSGKTFQNKKYQDEIALNLADANYAIMESGFANIATVAEQIVEIV